MNLNPVKEQRINKKQQKDYQKSKQRHIRIYHSKRRLTAQTVFKLSTHAPKKNLCVIELSGFKKILRL